MLFAFSSLDPTEAEVSVSVHGTEERPGARVSDITYWAAGGEPIRAYLVEPASAGAGRPATLYSHWFEPGNPTSSRLEFLDEAVEAAAGAGACALLPELSFPWAADPVGDAADLDRIVAQTTALRHGLHLLAGRPDVDPGRVAVVGHDYGGMYALLLATLDPDRIAALVVMNIDASWGNWFARFFLELSGVDSVAYERLFDPIAPVLLLAARAMPVLLQFADPDFYVPGSTRRALFSAAAEPKECRVYPDGGHELDAAARADRAAWLAATLRRERAPLR